MTPRFRFEPGKGWYRPDEGFTGWMEPLPFAPRVIACVAVMGELCEPPPTHDNAPRADLICTVCHNDGEFHHPFCSVAVRRLAQAVVEQHGNVYRFRKSMEESAEELATRMGRAISRSDRDGE